jgi:glycosyltransferase involved in cell wall biosynthesis
MDARVRKTAISVQAMGYRVTLLWAGPTRGEVIEEDLEGVRTIGLPVPYHLRVRAAQVEAKRAALRPRPLNLGYRDAQARRLRAAELAAWRARTGTIRQPLTLRWAELVHRFRSKILSASVGAHQRRYESHQRRYKERRLARPWRRELAEVADLDGIFTPWMIELAPDILHLHDIHLLSAGVNAKRYLAARGAAPKLIYDAHEYVRGMIGQNPFREAGFTGLERELITQADSVVTVSEPIADRLRQDLGLAVRPTVVLNSPPLAAGARASDGAAGQDGDGAQDSDGTQDKHGAAASGKDSHDAAGACASSVKAPSIRSTIGLPDDRPLAVYSGVLHANRRLSALVDGFSLLDGVDLALVCVPNTRYSVPQELNRLAAEKGMADRFHLVEPVAPEQVVRFLSSATLGVHPMALGLPNHEMALPNKLFDYIWAGLPVAVSQVAAMSELVGEAGIGATFDPDEPASIAAAVRLVLDNHAQMAAAARSPRLRQRFSWEAQMVKLEAVYQSLCPVTGTD